MSTGFCTRALAIGSITMVLIGSFVAAARGGDEEPPPPPPVAVMSKVSTRTPRRAPVRRPETPYVWPAAGRISSRFGERVSPVTGLREHHGAIDIACSYGSPVRAARGGKVLFGGRLPVFGRSVAVRHRGGWVSFYSHMRSLRVYGGRRVTKGEIIGRCGQSGRATGPHVHFEIRKPTGRSVNPTGVLPKRARR